ncbi:MAG: hypothetical protein ISR34_11020 [Pirellulales bacterium]|nr:hypothetical protein [Pirellulales bacterium]
MTTSSTRVMVEIKSKDSETSPNARRFGAAAECHAFPMATFDETSTTQAWHVLSRDEDLPVTP